MGARLGVAAAIVVLTLLNYFQFPGHTYLQADTQIYVPILEHIWDPSALPGDPIVLRPHVSFTIYDEVAEALTKLKQDGMHQLILDLRGNPGGLLDAAIEVCEKFLSKGQRIVEVRGRNTTPRVHEAPSNNQPETMPMVVLVNGHSASASEVV